MRADGTRSWFLIKSTPLWIGKPSCLWHHRSSTRQLFWNMCWLSVGTPGGGRWGDSADLLIFVTWFLLTERLMWLHSKQMFYSHRLICYEVVLSQGHRRGPFLFIYSGNFWINSFFSLFHQLCSGIHYYPEILDNTGFFFSVFICSSGYCWFCLWSLTFKDEMLLWPLFDLVSPSECFCPWPLMRRATFREGHYVKNVQFPHTLMVLWTLSGGRNTLNLQGSQIPKPPSLLFPLFILLQFYQDSSTAPWPLLLSSVTSCALRGAWEVFHCWP